MIDSDYQDELTDSTPTFPWPPREDTSVLDAGATTWKESVFSPTQFFRRMPREFDFGWVVGYYLIIAVIAGGIGLFWKMVLGPSFIERMMPANTAPANPLVDFLVSPIVLLIGLFIFTGIIHAFLLLFRGARYGFTTTVRVFCFASGPGLFVVLPIFGTIVGAVWSLVLTVIGLREAHETTTGKVIAALFVPGIVFGILAVLVMIASVAAGLVAAR